MTHLRSSHVAENCGILRSMLRCTLVGMLCSLLGCGSGTRKVPAQATAAAEVAAETGTTHSLGSEMNRNPTEVSAASGTSRKSSPQAASEQVRSAAAIPRATSESVGFRPGAMQAVDDLMARAVKRKAFPGAVVAIGRRGQLAHLASYGHLSYAKDARKVDADTIYDLASLTKVVVTTTAAMMLVDAGKLSLTDRVVDHLPAFTGKHKDEVTVGHLLSHASGVDWWAPLYEQVEGKSAYVERIVAMDLVYRPGSKSLYSDLGIILLGAIIERVAGENLDVFAQRRIFSPLGMARTSYRPSREFYEQIAPTEDDPWRGRVLHGEVHDENAYAMGGVAPHAGVFSTAGDLAQFAQMLLNRGVLGERRLVAETTVATFTQRVGVPGSERAYGWDTPSAKGSSAGPLSRQSFGHTGYTGTSIWIDPTRDLFVILLTNRVHPTRTNTQIREIRPALADAVVRGLAD